MSATTTRPAYPPRAGATSRDGRLCLAACALAAAVLVLTGCGGPRALDTGTPLIEGGEPEPAAIWANDLGRALEYPPVPVDEDWLAVVTEGPLYRLRGADGETLWRCKFPGAATTAPVVCGSIAVIGTVLIEGRLMGVDLETGDIRWKVEARSALPGGGGDVLVAAGRGGWVARFDPATGGELWRTRLAGAGWGAPVVRSAEGLALVSVRPDSVVALSLADGTRRWAASAGSWPLVSTAASGNVAAVAEAGRLVLLDPAGGTTTAERNLGSPPAGPPVRVDDRLVVALRDGRLAAFSAEDLAPVWSRTLEVPLVSPPAADGDRLAQSAPRGRIVIVDPATGEVLAERRHPEKLVAAGAWSDDRLAVGGVKGTLVLYRRSP